MMGLAVERSGDRLTTTAHLHKQRAAVPEHVESGGPLWGCPWPGAGVEQLHYVTSHRGRNPCPWVRLFVGLAGRSRHARGLKGMVGAEISSLSWQR